MAVGRPADGAGDAGGALGQRSGLAQPGRGKFGQPRPTSTDLGQLPLDQPGRAPSANLGQPQPTSIPSKCSEWFGTEENWRVPSVAVSSCLHLHPSSSTGSTRSAPGMTLNVSPRGPWMDLRLLRNIARSQHASRTMNVLESLLSWIYLGPRH
ncbi:hypothetical protein C8R44DRAFT_738873 [Mycena epipterygia]|nr:hypothetical protein C8R44DRAFT_738873 [Mycena epipterygia]